MADGTRQEPESRSLPHFLRLVHLVLQETISLEEARRRAVADDELLTTVGFPVAVELTWKFSCDLSVDAGCVAASLLHDWVTAQLPDQPAAVYETARLYVAAATQVLMERADVELYRRASLIAEQLVSSARALDNKTKLGDALTIASRLHLEPYAADPALDPQQSHYSWLQSLRRHKQKRRAWVVHEELGNEMPSYDEALQQADRYLIEATTQLEGSNRGAALVHLAFSLYSRALLGESVDRVRIRDYCDEAASLLPQENGDSLACVRLLWLISVFGEFSEFQARLPFLPWPLATAVKHYGVHLAASLYVTLVRVILATGGVSDISPIVDQLLPKHTSQADETREGPSVVSRLRETDRNFLELARVHQLPNDRTNCSDYSTISTLEMLRERAQGQQWQPLELGTSILHAVTHHPSISSASLVGLDDVQPDPLLLDQFLIVNANLEMRLAAAAVSEGVPAQAVTHLTSALNNYIKAGYIDLPSLIMHRIHWSFFRRHHDLEVIGADLSLDTVESLRMMSDYVYALLDETASDDLRQSWIQILAALWLARRCDHNGLTSIMQVLKGRALSNSLSAPAPLKDSQAAQILLAEIGAVERENGGLAGQEADAAVRRLSGTPLIDQEGILGAFMSARELQAGSSPAEVLRNMYRQYQRLDNDRLVAKALSATRPGIQRVTPYRTSAEVSQAMPQFTVLASICFGIIAVDEPDEPEMRLLKTKGFFAALYDSRGSYAMSVYDPSHLAGLDTAALVAKLGAGRGVIQYSEFGIRIAALRRSLLEDPVHRNVGRTASDDLAVMANYFEPLLNRLTTVHAPRVTHLCVWPQESLYFLPFQLLPWQGGILADQFAVTVIPSLEVLFAPRHRRNGNRFLAVACADGGIEYGLHSEPSLHAQAESIADSVGAALLVGKDATPSKVMELVQESQYVHIAAHGAQNVDAPAFHCMYLSGADGSSGRLYAHYILRCDLRGVELVTLSACESALLRFDVNDNLHGIAAAFLRSGARAVLGALWPVTADVADLFFATFYSKIAAESTKLGAYRLAQSVTRLKYPQYRDWAAFTLIGDWR